MAQITNQATLSYSSGATSLSTSSNVATVTMQGPLEVTKYPLELAYRIGDDVTYNVFLENTSAATLTNLQVVDDLGTYAITTTANVTPLTYIGPAKIFINDVYSTTVTGTVAAESVTFAVGSLPPGSTMLLQYKTQVNEYAAAVVGTSEIDNIVSVTATGITIPIIASAVIPVDSYASVTIEKQMSPDPVVDGSTLTYAFQIKNYGTIPATNVVLSDTFTTTPVITAVTLNGTPIADADYSYAAGVFQYPATASAATFTIPAATFTQDVTTGVVTVTPGLATVVIQGTI